jgi:hypothetical protein
MSIKAIEEFFLSENTKTKKRQGGLKQRQGQRPRQCQGQEHGQRHLVHANKIL